MQLPSALALCASAPLGATAEECQKRITFLPEPPLSEEQKAFLRTKFPGPLLREIRQTQANEILIRSSPSPAVSAITSHRRGQRKELMAGLFTALGNVKGKMSL